MENLKIKNQNSKLKINKMTTPTNYTVTDGLAQVTLLEKRILAAIKIAIFDVITYEKVVSPKLEAEIKQAEKDIKGGYQSLTALIETRHAIKAAIIKVNAGIPSGTVLINTVTILGKEYTPAELIERKKSLVLEKNLLHRMKESNHQTEKALELKKTEYADKLERHIANSVAAQGAKRDEAFVDKCTREFSPANQPLRLDPLGLSKEIAKYEEYIDTFESEIDRALSKFNATTLLEVV
jgi:hypothetical protein